MRKERGGKPDTNFLKGVVKTEELPTAVANAADHYVVLQPGKSPRFMTVQEVARSFEVPTVSPLMEALTSRRTMTAGQTAGGWAVGGRVDGWEGRQVGR